jgi:hypothetical protein
VAFTHPELLILEMMHLDIILEEENYEGQTVKNTSAPFNVAVATSADSSAFEDLFIDAINQEKETSGSSQTTTSTKVTSGYLIPGSIVLCTLVGISRKKVRKKHRK